MRMSVCRLSCGAEGAGGARLLHERAWRRVVLWAVEVELCQSDVNGYAGKPARRTTSAAACTSRSNRNQEQTRIRVYEGSPASALVEYRIPKDCSGSRDVLPNAHSTPKDMAGLQALGFHINQGGFAATCATSHHCGPGHVTGPGEGLSP